MVVRSVVPRREQDTTGFTRILQNVVHAMPGVMGTALVDGLGECVDYAGLMDAFEIRLVAAHAQIEFRNARAKLSKLMGTVRGLTIYASKRTMYAMQIVDEYHLVLVFAGGNPSNLSPRALAQAEYDIRVEAGWEPTPDIERWIHLQVDARMDARWRPSRVQFADAWHDVEVIGTVVGLLAGERGFRVRTPTGAEMTLVRERHGHWYADVRY